MSAQDARSEDWNDMIFILAGQSNMAGRGEIIDEEREPTLLPVWSYLSEGNELFRWTRASEPLHRVADGAEMRMISGSPAKAPRRLRTCLRYLGFETFVHEVCLTCFSDLDPYSNVM